jgi:hypothetical protein
MLWIPLALSLVGACGDQPLNTEAQLTAELGSMDVISGNAQTGLVGSQLSSPLVVRVTSPGGGPIKNQIVNFRVTEGGGSVYAGTALTDSGGLAQEWLTLGPAVGKNRVEARAVDSSSGEKVVFASFEADGVDEEPVGGGDKPPAGGDGGDGGGDSPPPPPAPPEWATGEWLLTIDTLPGELDLTAGTTTLPIYGTLPATTTVSGTSLGVQFTIPTVGAGSMSLSHADGQLTGTAQADGRTASVTGRRPGTERTPATPEPEEPAPAEPEPEDPTPPAIAAIAVSPAARTLDIGNTLQLSAQATDGSGTVLTGRTFTWSSSNSGVASVTSSGLITARAAGSATITATSGGVRGTATITVNAAAADPPPPPSQSGYPNRPNGLTVIGAADGSVKESGGSAFGISSFGGWNTTGQTNVSVVSDATNPTGSGSSLRFKWAASGNSAGAAAANRFNSGTVRQLYVMTRIYMESGGWDFGHKFFYIGAPSGSRNNTGSPTQFYSTRERGDHLRFINQNLGSEVIVDSSDPAPRGANTSPFVRDRWLNIEYLMVAESSPGAGDGRMSIWVNNQLVGSDNSVQWTDRSDPTVGFDGMEWYARANSVTADSYYRLGELYIAGN